MPDIKRIKQEIAMTESIKLITDALGDIATGKIKQQRVAVENNIRFFHEILLLYRTVKRLARRTKAYAEIEGKKQDKTALVLVSSNYKFNGNLDSELCNSFMKQTETTVADRFVIGQMGIDILKARGYKHEFVSIVFKQDYPSLDELRELVNRLFVYKRIYVFHSKFETLLNQRPVVTDVTAEDPETQAKIVDLHYIVEPEIDKMLRFFADQILTLLLQAIFLESDIARTAARMISMNQADAAAEKMLKDERKELIKMRKVVLNRRIIESYVATESLKLHTL